MPDEPKLLKPQIIEHVRKSVDYTVYQAHWIPTSPKFVVLGCTARSNGVISIYELGKSDAQLIKQHQLNTAIKCGTFGAANQRQRHLAIGNFKGRLQVWDLERIGSGQDPVVAYNAHEQIINCVDGCGGLGIGDGAAELATASRDGWVRIWDPRQQVN